MSVTKSELVDHIAARADLTKGKALQALESFIEVITESLKKNEDVSLIGFGTFRVSHRKSRAGFNPRTGEKIIIPAQKSVAFRVGKGLKSSLN